MKSQKVISILTCIMVATGLLAAGMGIFSNAGNGPYKYSSIRGKEVLIYGKGIYRHMSAEVAPQGIAQDYVSGSCSARYCTGLRYLLLRYPFPDHWNHNRIEGIN
jgi:hypothetical protein